MSGASRSESDGRVGSVLAGKYRLGRLLGAGGMGSVYEATNTWTERRVALKLLHPALSQDPELSGRFLREARVATRVAHPNIVEVLDMGQDSVDGSLYLVQEFLDGADMRALLDRRGRLDVREAFGVLVPVMSALVAAHAKGVVHRDLKPENIFLAKNSSGAVVPKLIDFGIAKIADPALDKGLTKTGAAIGTPYYMSPEQARGEREIDAQTDVWALGVVWFEALAGKCPFEGDNYNQLLAKILTEAPASLVSVAPATPEGVGAAVDRALRRDRAQRWKTVGEFLESVLTDCALEGEPWFAALRASSGPLGLGFAEAGALVAPDHRAQTLRDADGSAPTTRAMAPGSVTTLGRSATGASLRSESAGVGSRLGMLAGAAAVLLGLFGVGAMARGVRHSAVPSIVVLRSGQPAENLAVSSVRSVVASSVQPTSRNDGLVAPVAEVMPEQIEVVRAPQLPRREERSVLRGSGAPRAEARASARLRPSSVLPVQASGPSAEENSDRAPTDVGAPTPRPERPVINSAPVLGM